MSGFKRTSNDMQNELVESVTHVIHDKITVMLDSCNVLKLSQMKLTTSQVFIIFRLCSKEINFAVWNYSAKKSVVPLAVYPFIK